VPLKGIIIPPVQAPRPVPPNVVLQAEAPIEQQQTIDQQKTTEQQKSSTTVSLNTTSASIPEWVNEKSILADDKRLIVLSSQQYATAEDADADIINQARNNIREELRQAYHYDGEPPIPQKDIDKYFGRRHVEQITRHAGSHTFQVFRVHRQLELSNAVRRTFEPLWRNQNGRQRLWGLTTVAGFLTLVIATLAAYFRIDTRTGSAYRGRLRFAAACLILAGAVVAVGALKVGLNTPVPASEVAFVPR
jgi:hypothetical protein